MIIKSPIEIIYHVCALIRYWAGLYSEPDRKQLEDGLNTMLQIANKILKRQKKGDDNSGDQVSCRMVILMDKTTLQREGWEMNSGESGVLQVVTVFSLF